MPPVNWTRHAAEADFALRAVTAAAGICRAAQQEARRWAQRKPDASPVTEADFASQALIGGWLAEAFPHDPLIAEEDSQTLEAEMGLAGRVLARLEPLRPEADEDSVRRWLDHGARPPGDRFWALDPIDGTKGFLRGGQYVVALALIEEGQVVVAALAAPSLAPDLRPVVAQEGCAAVAVRGEGAWVMPLDGGAARRLSASGRADASRARLVCSFEDEHTDWPAITRLRHALGLTAEPIRMDSQAKYLIVAGGEADLLVRLLPQAQPGYKEKIWDVAAGTLIVEEAGGRVTDLVGRSLDLTTGRELTRNQGGLVTNGQVHEAVLQALRAERLGGEG